MRNLLQVDPSDAVPIWKQIEEALRNLVGSRVLEPGTAIFSVRELARELRVNPATVSKAYQRLTEAGVLEVRRGQGTFVSEQAPILKEGEKALRLQEGARRYVSLARTIAVNRQGAIGELRAIWSDLDDHQRGKGA